MSAAPIGLWMLVFLVALALAFDFMNGFHDAANSVATVVSTRVLRPQWAVAWAAFFNFIAFLFFGLAVANTIGKGVIESSIVDHYVIIGALVCGEGQSNWFKGVQLITVYLIFAAMFYFMPGAA